MVDALLWLGLAALVLVASRHVRLRRRPRSTTQAFCPRCGNELVSCPLTTCADTDLVRYICGRCQTASAWDFDAPVPLLIDHVRVVEPGEPTALGVTD